MIDITLDFTGIKSLWNLHEYFKEVFDLPEYYGHNMDALWDCLPYSFEFPTTIILKNISALPKEMAPGVETMLELFHDLEQEDKNVTVKNESNEKPSNISDYLV